PKKQLSIDILYTSKTYTLCHVFPYIFYVSCAPCTLHFPHDFHLEFLIYLNIDVRLHATRAPGRIESGAMPEAW
ncbi:hypothetical protein FRC11_003694, partial [Ceratobasidium sp. 423]